MEARPKRSEDGATPSDRTAELLSELAVLRDQESRLLKQLDIANVDLGKPLAQLKPSLHAVDAPPAFAAEPLDYETKRARLEQERSLRVKAIWKACSNILKQVKGTKAALAWFCTPVPIEQNPGYLDVVKKPMDLSLVKEKIDRGYYTTPMEVAEDVRLIWTNCERYTPIPAAPVRIAARHVSQSFEKKWGAEQGIEAKWREEMARQRAEDLELEELRTASTGSVVEKLKYFDNRVIERLRALAPAPATPGSTWTFEQKRKLSAACAILQMDALYGLMEVIAAHYPLDLSGSDEIELDIDALPDDVLHKMQLYVEDSEATANKSRPGRPTSQAGASSAHNEAAANHVHAATASTAANHAVKSETNAKAAGAGPGAAAAADGAAGAPAAAASGGAAAPGAAPQEEPSETADKDASSSTSNSSSSSGSGDSKSSKGGNSEDDAGSKEKVESTMPEADKKWVVNAAVDVGDASALVSATQPRSQHPIILKEGDAHKNLEVQNDQAWELLRAEPEGPDADGSVDAEGLADAKVDPLWEDLLKKSELQEERARQQKEADAKAAEQKRAEEEAAKEKNEASAQEGKAGEAETGDPESAKRKREGEDEDTEAAELERRAAKRAKDLEDMNNTVNGEDEDDDDMGFGDAADDMDDTS